MPERIKVSEIMSDKPIAINTYETVQKAALIMRKNNISGLIVARGKFAVAMVTLKDIAIKVVTEALSSRNVKVKDVMSSRIITAQKDETLTEVAKRMISNDISRIPVLDKNDNILGIVTKTDLLRVMPALINLFYEKEKEETIPVPERLVTEGICEECRNYSDELREVNGRWLCEECAEIKTLIDP
ncbi:MAG: hypothetical protein DRN66_03225 [Candidatus Nanohalarchaeota archaeon]|nr:MAG: hypothetical protein DRN66_03225 [Candidatus Nanohaloarchaeota archaeon]